MRTLRAALLAFGILAACSKPPVVVGSKNFTESVVLGEIVAQRLERAGCRVDRKLDLGGSIVCDKAITSGAIDVYPEYSGTALTAILHRPLSRDRQSVSSEVQRGYEQRGLHWGPVLGFENTFAMIVRRADAERLGLRSISDLARVTSSSRPGFGYEFVERPDGWSGLQKHYGLTFAVAPKTMDLGLTYRALAAGEVDLIAGNSTDGLIDRLGLVVLRDDRSFFPPYDTALVTGKALSTKCSAATDALMSLANAIDDKTMRRLNDAVDTGKKSPADVARAFLDERH
jgi:glycine betaine/choline ABC-type transport system substrate-binding protein